MTSHIEWAHARYVQVSGIAHAGEFENDDVENQVACVVLTDANGDGMCIEGPPDDLVSLAHRILNAAHGVKSDINADPQLRAMYGIIQPLDYVPPEKFRVVRHADRGDGQRDVSHGLTRAEAEAHIEDLQSHHKPDDRWPGRYTIEPDAVPS